MANPPSDGPTSGTTRLACSFGWRPSTKNRTTPVTSAAAPMGHNTSVASASFLPVLILLCALATTFGSQALPVHFDDRSLYESWLDRPVPSAAASAATPTPPTIQVYRRLR